MKRMDRQARKAYSARQRRIFQLRTMFEWSPLYRQGQTPRTARFWICGPAAEPVRITLRPGESVAWGWGSTAWDGWSQAWERYTHDAETGRIESEWVTDGRDCDGRLTQAGSSFVGYDGLSSGYRESADVVYPEWEAGESSQRDEYAEASGY